MAVSVVVRVLAAVVLVPCCAVLCLCCLQECTGKRYFVNATLYMERALAVSLFFFIFSSIDAWVDEGNEMIFIIITAIVIMRSIMFWGFRFHGILLFMSVFVFLFFFSLYKEGGNCTYGCLFLFR